MNRIEGGTDGGFPVIYRTQANAAWLDNTAFSEATSIDTASTGSAGVIGSSTPAGKVTPSSTVPVTSQVSTWTWKNWAFVAIAVAVVWYAAKRFL
jgi:hypothetical protein